ncbi:MAG: S-methyl-5-thioribose-1-phosphate isomerase [Chthonomonadales bacterium]
MAFETKIKTVFWEDGRVCMIDQTLLPGEFKIVRYAQWEEVVESIRTMVVRGAPAIGCTAALGMALAAQNSAAITRANLDEYMAAAGNVMKGARPTAVNLEWAVNRMLAKLATFEGSAHDATKMLLDEAMAMLDEDIAVNRAMGKFGAELIPNYANVLTHCNAGALATVGYGTALGVIRAAVEAGKNIHVYADETRPRLQGMKLTAWELSQDNIPVTIIADNMAGVLMRECKIDCVVVGADRIAANGDAANKIGTYSVAVLAKHHKVPFYVAAPFSTIDAEIPDGSAIEIEERDHEEVTHIQGVRIAPEGPNIWNPSFDVTPNELITGIITERGVLTAPYAVSIQQSNSNS